MMSDNLRLMVGAVLLVLGVALGAILALVIWRLGK